MNFGFFLILSFGSFLVRSSHELYTFPYQVIGTYFFFGCFWLQSQHNPNTRYSTHICTLLIIWKLIFWHATGMEQVLNSNKYIYYGRLYERWMRRRPGRALPNAGKPFSVLFLFCMCKFSEIFICCSAWTRARTLIYGLFTGYNNNICSIKLFQCHPQNCEQPHNLFLCIFSLSLSRHDIHGTCNWSDNTITIAPYLFDSISSNDSIKAFKWYVSEECYRLWYIKHFYNIINARLVP